MKTFFTKALFLGLTGFLPLSVAWSQEQAANVHKMELTDIQSLEVDGKFKVVLSQGIQESAEIEAPAEILHKMTAKQGGKKFILSVKDKDAREHEPFKVRLVLKNPQQISLKGMVSLEVQNVLACKKMYLQLSDEATFDGEVRTSENIDISMSGHSRMKASLTAIKSGKVELSDYATVEAKGYMPALVLVQGGDTKFGTKECSTDRLDAKLSGMSTAGLRVNKILNATVEDGSVLRYAGMPKTKVNSSGVAKVEAY